MAQERTITPNYHARLKDAVIAEPSPRWIKVTFNGQVVATSKQALYVKDSNRKGEYFFPRTDVRGDYLKPTDKTVTSEAFGTGVYYDIVVDGKHSEAAALEYTQPISDQPDLTGYINIRWNKVDQWFEESEEVFGSLRNPYHRIDTVKSSRHIRVVVNGQTVAETDNPTLLFETGLPPRYYIPQQDIKLELFEPTDTTSYCQYKGHASYWSYTSGGKSIKDIAWSYLEPIPESNKIKGLIAFYPDRVDAIYVDGEVQPSA